MNAVTLTPEASAAHTIRAAGRKVTVQRLAVLGTLRSAPHSSAEQVFAAVRDELPGTSPQAVYAILSAFTVAALVRRLDPAGSPALFECRVGDNHHHIICVHCGELRDIDCVIGEAPCLTPSETWGYTILAAVATFTGLCGGCRDQLAALEAQIPAP